MNIILSLRIGKDNVKQGYASILHMGNFPILYVYEAGNCVHMKNIYSQIMMHKEEKQI